jgi:pSer/pThr/pTyr-binding forkhead associated (FHA) protein
MDAAATPVPPAAWVVVLDDGRELSVGHLTLLGRNPEPRPGEEDAELVKVADTSRTVSKSHLALRPDGDRLSVTDLGSTNGSTVTDYAGASQPCRPGEPVSVTEGTIVSFGDHWLEVRRDSRR